MLQLLTIVTDIETDIDTDNDIVIVIVIDNDMSAPLRGDAPKHKTFFNFFDTKSEQRTYRGLSHFKIVCEANTTIIHYSLFTIH